MSVFQRGGSYLHRRLTKLYSDTKQSYETATVASKTKADEDPILKALHREFRIQKDRLLAWGLQWSDSNATPSPDVEIDQKLDQAGLGHVVALVMSDIQKLLIESEMIQNPRPGLQDKMSGGQVDSKAPSTTNEMTSDDIAKSRSLLSRLITCIDSLYKLSESRRTLSTDSQIEKASRALLTKDNPMSITTPSSQAQGQRSFSEVAREESQIEELVYQDKLFIDSSCITHSLDPALESEKPPPYEEVMPLEKTRLPGMLDVASLSGECLSALEIQDRHQKPVVVEYLPTVPDGGSALYDQYCAALRYAQRIFEHQSSQEVSHTGSLRLLGYTIDISNARHGFVYEMPFQTRHNDFGHNLPIVSSLRAVIPSKRDDSDPPSPNLEDRFRLAFNILLSMLHLSMQGLLLQNLNSTNIVLLLDRQAVPHGAQKSDLAPCDIRRPYLLHAPPSPAAANTPHRAEGPLSASIYRHADDTVVGEKAHDLAFDIYSFGLILLEIGLWTPLSRLWKAKYDRPTFTSRIKNIYVPKLASRCGTAYMKVVQTCINAPGLFQSDSGHATLKQKEQYLLSYLMQIGRDLSRCCAIDVEGPPCKPDLAYFERINDEGCLREARQDPNQKISAPGPSHRSATSSASADILSRAESGDEPRFLLQKQQTVLKKWNNVDIPQECLDQWNTHLMPKISKLLQKALDSSRESCSASLMMVGKTPETAKTTICIQCMSVEKVRDCFRRNFRCKNGWGLVVLRGDIRRSGKARREEKSHDSTRSRLRPPPPDKSTYQEKPQFGASIGAFRDNEHLPPVSFGGSILVDGKPYGMTVHHMLDAPSDDEDAIGEEDLDDVQRSGATGSDAWLPDLHAQHRQQHGHEDVLESSEVLEISDDESECSTIRPDYIHLDTGIGGFWFAGDSDGTPDLEDDLGPDSDEEDSSDVDDDDEDGDDDDDDRESVGDIIGIDPAGDEEVYVTQPAIDDVDDDFFPCMEDRDDDHLASHALGYVHASSGIRRVVTGSLKHEVDWALIKIRDERLTVSNAIRQHLRTSKRRRRTKEKMDPVPSSAQHSSRHLTAIVPSHALPRLPVHCHGRTSGLRSGRISPALALVKLHGRTSFSSSWVVEGGGFGVPGDSGAWIYDPHAGRLCGHVLAWGSQSRTAYMAPMEVLFEDIRRRLGADRVELPGSQGLGLAASKQLERSELDLLQDGMQNLHIPADSSLSIDEDAEMKKDDDSHTVNMRPLELALGNVQICDKRPSAAQQSSPVALGSKGKGKDLPNSLTCQAQDRRQGLDKVLGERVLGSRVA
jgi:hypothetical protein